MSFMRKLFAGHRGRDDGPGGEQGPESEPDRAPVGAWEPDPDVRLDGEVAETGTDGAAAPVDSSNSTVDNSADERPSGDIVVRLAGAGVRRGQTHLVRDINWSVELDERWVVLGPNGAGKTTIVQLASAYLHPTTGTVYVLGERLGRVDIFELRPRIGLTSAALAQRIPGGERVDDVVMSAGYSVIGRWRESYEGVDAARAATLLNQFGVSHLSTRAFGTLSEGERKRVQIARALMTDPELVLLDEPAAGLDLGSREDLVARLGRLAADADAPALILVTHHVEEIPPGFTHALLLRDGRVVAQGLLTDVLTSENLSATFGLPLTLERAGDRYFARATGEPPIAIS
jgi:iron complex transport system ATP-binding protein